MDRENRLSLNSVPAVHDPAQPDNHCPDEAAELHRALAHMQRREIEQATELHELETAYEQVQIQLLGYRQFFDYVPEALLLTDLAGNIFDANHASVLLFRMPREFLVKKPLGFLIDSADRQEFFTRLNRLRWHSEAIHDWHMTILPREGAPIHATATVTVVVENITSVPNALRWLIRDATSLFRTEQAFQAEKEFNDSLLDAARALVFVLDSEGVIRRVNPYLQIVTGRPEEEILDHDWRGLIPPAEWPQAQELLFRALGADLEAQAVLSLQTRQGRPRVVTWSGRLLTQGEKDRPSVLLVGSDITELQHAQEQALRLDRLATIGLIAAGLAHESRNALQRGQACLERLRWKLQDRPDVLDLVNRLQRAQDDLLRLYEDARGYAAPIHLERSPCDLAALWRTEWEQIQELHPDRKLDLREVIDGDVTCAADAFRLRQVFRNILDNAVAACIGRARVDITCRPTLLNGRSALRISVRDYGPGLNAEQQQRLFEPFYTTKTKGTGLGMSIARRIIEAHGGQIIAGAPPPPGAEILITLPRSPA